jgi:hypothetical protein
LANGAGCVLYFGAGALLEAGTLEACSAVGVAGVAVAEGPTLQDAMEGAQAFEQELTGMGAEPGGCVACAITTSGEVIVGSSYGTGFQGTLSPSTFDELAPFPSKYGIGACAECSVLNTARERGFDLTGAVMQTCRMETGKPMPACDSCSAWMDALGIRYK